jgi:ubiquinone/menaquinone biosynthesis C-methylase UbiE
MQRVLEPELMEDAEQVIAYAEADFDKPHSEFINRLSSFINEPDFSGTALDLGCGPGDISRRFAKAYPLCKLDAIDGSKAMIDYALNSIGAELNARLNFIVGTLPDAQLPKSSYDIIFSNSLLHHLPDPQILWQTIKKHAKANIRIAIMDLLRPDTTDMAEIVVKTYAANEPDILKRDFYFSLLAAFTLDEIAQQIAEAGLSLTMEQISDRHVFISGTLP